MCYKNFIINLRRNYFNFIDDETEISLFCVASGESLMIEMYVSSSARVSM